MLFITVFIAGMTFLTQHAHAAEFIRRVWSDTEKIKITYIWDVPSERAGYYVDQKNGGSIPEVLAVEAYVMGIREVFSDMNLTQLLNSSHSATWIQLYTVATNQPDGSNDFPPHLNLMNYMEVGGNKYAQEINGHFYTTSNGKINTGTSNWYAVKLPNCPTAPQRVPGVGVWVQRMDQNCQLIWEEQITTEGDLLIRRGITTYRLENTAPSNLNIYKNNQLIRNIQQRGFDGEAKSATYEIRDYARNVLITETFSGVTTGSESPKPTRTETPLTGGQPTATPQPNATATSAPPTTQPQPTATPGGSNYSCTTTVSTTSQLQSALSSASAGDVICMNPGTYNGRMEVRSSGASGRPIVLTTKPGSSEKAVITGGSKVYSSSQGSRGVLEIQSRNYVTIDNIKIIDAPYYGIYLSNAENIVIRNVDIDHTFSSAIHVGNTRNIVIENNYIQHATHGLARWGDTSDGNCATNGSHCTPHEWISLRGGTDGFEVRYNRLDNTKNPELYPKDTSDHAPGRSWIRSKEGIDAKEGSSNGKIYGNYIDGLARNAIYLDAYDDYVKNIKVFNNTVVNFRNSGINIAAETPTGVSENIKIYNNLVANGGHTGIWASNLKCTYCAQSGIIRNVVIAYNTVYNNGYRGVASTNTRGENIVFANNIIFKNGEGSPQGGAQNYYYQTGTGTTESNNFYQDPKFVNASAGDFHLRSDSPVIGQGNSTGAPSFDMDCVNCNNRPKDGYDIGADEYDSSGGNPQPTTPPAATNTQAPTIEPRQDWRQLLAAFFSNAFDTNGDGIFNSFDWVKNW